jgi:hypothetical protein
MTTSKLLLGLGLVNDLLLGFRLVNDLILGFRLVNDHVYSFFCSSPCTLTESNNSQNSSFLKTTMYKL